MAFVILPALALAAALPPRGFQIPPKAAAVTGAIGEVELAPLFRQPFACQEHYFGQLAYAGDALGTDCLVTGGVDGESGFSKFYRTDGKTNADWYGWHSEVLAPFDATIIGVLAKPEENAPGTLGKPPAAMIQFRRADGVIVVFAHVTDIRVKVGERVAAGQIVALDGNNGYARSPHVHVGAYREGTAEPLQIRWDLRALAAAQAG